MSVENPLSGAVTKLRKAGYPQFAIVAWKPDGTWTAVVDMEMDETRLRNLAAFYEKTANGLRQPPKEKFDG